MTEILADILGAILAEFLADWVLTQFNLDVGLGPVVMVAVLIAYVLAKWFAQRRANAYLHTQPAVAEDDLQRWKRRMTYVELRAVDGYLISALGIGMLLAGQYYPWVNGIRSIAAWLVALIPAMVKLRAVQRADARRMRFAIKISDRIRRYGYVTERWLNEAFPLNDREVIRQEMQLYVEGTFGQAERLDASDARNWAIRRGGYGRDVGTTAQGG
jgi:hypothetical protein